MFWRLYTELHQLPSRVGVGCSRSMNPITASQNCRACQDRAALALCSTIPGFSQELLPAPGGPSGANLVADLLLRSEGARFSFGVIFCGSISPKRLCGFRSCAQHSVNLQLSSNPDLSCCLLQPGIASLSAQDKFLLVSMETQDLQQVWLLLLIKRKRMKGGEKIKP